ncbi:MAG TPA: hypothetical protein VFQ76_09550, partial [Longimicrobiaceae bacterium]|nr:hypothetical protein [Longimicrobiaceae bacterium]
AMLELVLLLHIPHHSRTNPPALLDERERAERDQAYRRAYRILSWGVAALILYAWAHLRWGWGWTPVTSRDWIWTWYPGALAMAALPSAVIAWNGLDLPAEDPEDAEAERAALRGVPLSSVRLRVIGALTVVCLGLSAAQYAGFGVLPSRYGSGLFAGTACGLLFGMALLWNWERQRKSP